MTESHDDKSDARKIEKRRSWMDISASASSAEDPSSEDYAIELQQFEQGEIDKSLWAKHLVEAKGDENEAKWRYVKERVKTAPARRAEQQEAERKAAEAAERRRREQQEAERKAAEESERKRQREEIAQRKAAEEAERRRREQEEAERAVAITAEKDARKRSRIEARRRRIAAAWEVLSDTLVLANTNRAWTASVLLVFFLLIVIFNLVPEPETRAANLINESWRNFVGDRGVVDEELAISKVEEALSLIADRGTAEAIRLQGYAYNNLAVYRNCAVGEKLRDKKVSEQARSEVIDLNEFWLENALWNVFWGDLLADTVNTPQQYYSAIDLMRDWEPIQLRERYPEKTPLEVLKLMDEKRSELEYPHHIAARQIAFYYECRAESQDIGLAVEWYQTALERLPLALEPVSADHYASLNDEQKKILDDLEPTYLARENQSVNERLRRLRLVKAYERQ